MDATPSGNPSKKRKLRLDVEEALKSTDSSIRDSKVRHCASAQPWIAQAGQAICANVNSFCETDCVSMLRIDQPIR